MYKKEIGQIIPGLKINWELAPYWVLNERSIRATAGIMFLVWIITVLYTFFNKDFLIVSIVLPIFFINFIILILWGPKYSPFSQLGNYLVRKQKPEYVWAIQKRFAWFLGFLMSWSVMLLMFWFWITWLIPLALCSTCLALMWMESSLWICVWCKLYYWLIKKGLLSKPQYRPACPWGACALNFNKK